MADKVPHRSSAFISGHTVKREFELRKLPHVLITKTLEFHISQYRLVSGTDERLIKHTVFHQV